MIENNPYIVDHLKEFGTSVFTEMTQLALEHDAINLSQGYPDFDGPDFVTSGALEALHAGKNQYAPSIGIRSLRKALSATCRERYNLSYDFKKEITVFSGATEALFSSLQALIEPGEEVILFEPYYDAYPPAIKMAGGERISFPLSFPDYEVPLDRVADRIGPDTAAIMLNTPMNPTGKVFTRSELQQLAELCREHDLLVITDEVYEMMTFDDAEHIPISKLSGMKDRTVMISSAAKTFSVTGWKIGWACASPELTEAIRSAHQFTVFSSATPLQHGVAKGLEEAESYYEDLRSDYQERRDVLCDILEDIGFRVTRPDGTYFVLADFSPFGFEDDRAFCKYITRELRVAAIPPTAFYDHTEEGKTLARFAFCKDVDTLKEAGNRLEPLSSRR